MLAGKAVSHYRIVSRLGAGGMGQVWLAEDTQLERLVALKILSPQLVGDKERKRRFEQEARAVAALNHPNIAQIHQYGEDGGAPWLAMEYVDGQTLRERIGGHAMPLDEIIEIAIDVTDALEHAHSKGIVHRDIKPGNIALTQRGEPKVLDFGLAKMERRHAVGDSDTEPLTVPGEVMGTRQYMSPEQCLGQEVDHRTDIFSFGAVLYEMATGKQAFAGPSPAAVCDAILNRHPQPPRRLNPQIPAEFDRIVRRAMEKDRELRYQTVSDLRADLRRVKRDTESVIEAAALVRRKPRWLILAAALAAAAGIAGLAYYSRSAEPAPNLRATPLTSFPGSETQPSFSPDGNQFAFAWNSSTEENWDIYVKVLDAGTPLRLTTSPAPDVSPAWSPDGRYIAFLRQAGADSGFFLVPALGGLEQRIGSASPHRVGVDTPYVAWSPDGRTLAVADKQSPEEPMAIFLMSMATGERRRLTSPPPKTFGDSSPVFSTDGRQLYFVRTASLSVQDIYSIPVAGGQPRRITNDNRRIFGMAWSPSDERIVFTSSRQGNPRIWKVSPSGGDPERLVGIGENASLVAVTRDGGRLAYTRSILDMNVWRYDLSGASQPVMLLSSTRYEQGPQYSPDGRHVAFASNRSGALEIWVSDAEGVDSMQLTSFNGPPTGTPHWSPDGRLIAFDSRPDGNPDIYIVARDGGVPRRLTSEPSEEIVPSFSADGQWVYFVSNRTGQYQVWKQPVDGGAAVQVTKNGGFHAHESPDGRFVYYAKSSNEPGLWRMPAGGGEETPVLESFGSGFWGYWTVRKSGVYYLQREQKEGAGAKYFLDALDPETGRRRRVLAFDRRPFNSGLDISPDERACLYTQVDQSETDIMLVENFR